MADIDLLAGTDTFAASYLKLNTTAQALEDDFYAATEPATKTPGKTWVDSANQLIKRRNAANSAWYVEGVFDSPFMGLLPRDGSEAMESDLDFGGNRGVNLAAPSSGGDAVRLSDLSAYATLAGPAFTSLPTVSADPTTGDQLARKSWIDTNFMKADGTGGALTDPPQVLSDADIGNELVRLSQLQAFTGFDTGVGHNHNGTNSRRVGVTDVSHAGPAENLPIMTGASNRLKVGKSTSLRFVIADTHPLLFTETGAVADGAVSTGAPLGAQLAILRAVFRTNDNTYLELHLRREVSHTQAQYRFQGAAGSGLIQDVKTLIVGLDSSRNFRRQVTKSGSETTGVNVSVYLIGWFEI